MLVVSEDRGLCALPLPHAADRLGGMCWFWLLAVELDNTFGTAFTFCIWRMPAALNHAMPRYKLRTLLIVATVGPPVLAFLLSYWQLALTIAGVEAFVFGLMLFANRFL